MTPQLASRIKIKDSIPSLFFEGTNSIKKKPHHKAATQLNNVIVKPPENLRSLFDSFGRKHDYLRISITERCNLRCTYCMPSDGIELSPEPNLMTTEEIIRASKLFVDMGITKIRLTGGEPLVRKDFDFLAEKLKKLKERGLEKICITTNGVALQRKIPILKKSDIRYINISLDSLQEHKFEFVTRRKGYNKVMKSIYSCIEEPDFYTKINCVCNERCE